MKIENNIFISKRIYDKFIGNNTTILIQTVTISFKYNLLYFLFKLEESSRKSRAAIRNHGIRVKRILVINVILKL